MGSRSGERLATKKRRASIARTAFHMVFSLAGTGIIPICRFAGDARCSAWRDRAFTASRRRPTITIWRSCAISPRCLLCGRLLSSPRIARMHLEGGRDATPAPISKPNTITRPARTCAPTGWTRKSMNCATGAALAGRRRGRRERDRGPAGRLAARGDPRGEARSAPSSAASAIASLRLRRGTAARQRRTAAVWRAACRIAQLAVG